jgi:Zn-dependent protease with chaperone function
MEPGGIRFLGEDASGAAWLPLAGLDVRMTGMNLNVPELRHPAAEGWVVVCHDADFLKAFAAEVPKEILATAPNRPWTGLVKATALLVALLVLFLFGVYMAWRPVSNWIVSVVPTSWEQQLGEVSLASMKAGSKPAESGPEWDRLQAAIAKLKPALEGKGYNFTFHLIDDPDQVNAFACPGGHVVIYTGLLKVLTSEAQVTGVLAHEAAHVLERHSLHQMVDTAGMGLLFAMLLGDAQYLAGFLTDTAQSALGMKFSRDAEANADTKALQLLHQTAQPLAGLRESLAAMEADAQKRYGLRGESWDGGFFSTHPATAERIAHLEALERQVR